MTRFEEAKQSEFDMALMVAFCIAGYLEQYDNFKFPDDELKTFLERTYPDIEKWLMEEKDETKK